MHQCLPPNLVYYPSVFRSKEICDDFEAGVHYLKSTGRHQEIHGRHLKRPC